MRAGNWTSSAAFAAQSKPRTDEAAAIDSRRDALISLLAEVARNYIDVRGLQRELAIARDNVKAQQDTVDLTRSRFQAGLATDLDVARAEAQVATTTSQIPPLRTSLAQAIHHIAVLLGQDPTSLESELSKDAPIPSLAAGHPDRPSLRAPAPAGRISAGPSASSRQPTPASALQPPIFSRASH